MALSTPTSTLSQALLDHAVEPDYSASYSYSCSVFLWPSDDVVESSLPPYLAKPTLPGSIVPSDMSSLFGSSMPTTLVMDTKSRAAPSSTAWATPTTATTDSDTPSRTLTTLWSSTNLAQGSPTPTQTVTVGVGAPVSVAPKAGAAAPSKVSVGCRQLVGSPFLSCPPPPHFWGLETKKSRTLTA